MIIIENIIQAIEKASKLQSNLTPENYSVPGLVSLRGRHLYNNLGALASNSLEIGCHLGCSFTSTVTSNTIKTATVIDSFASDWVEDRKCMPIFLENAKKYTPAITEFKFIHSDAFEVDLNDVPNGIDYYVYDGSHDEQSQKKALTYYYEKLADEFLFICDDYDWEEVQKGTQNAIRQLKLKIVFEQYLKGNDHDNDGYWNGYYIGLLKK